MGGTMPPLVLKCHWCGWTVTAFHRGGHGQSQGSGHEAALFMQQHVEQHGKTWAEWLAVSEGVTA